MTDHPSALVSVPEPMIEAFRDWYALHFGRPIMKGKARKIVGRILSAAPAAPQAAGVGEERVVVETAVSTLRWAMNRGDDISGYKEPLELVMTAALRAPSREPEGGAVDERLKWFLKVIEGAGGEVCSTESRHNPINVFCEDRDNGDDTFNISEAAGYTQTSHDTSFDTSTTRITDKGRAYLAALATREEAPAEAGEIGAEYDDAAHCVTLDECPPGLFLWNGTLGFKSEYGAMEPVGISPHHQQWKVGNRVDAYCADSGEYFWGGTSNHDDRAKLLVYPVSADAVAMVASHGPSALRAQPQAREGAQPVISAGRVLADALRQYGFPVSGGAKAALWDHGSAEALALNEACVAFLAALQAEQKGGAA